MCFELNCKSLTGAREKGSSTPPTSEDAAESWYQLWLSHHPKSTCPAQPSLHLYLCSFSGNSQARDSPESAANANLPGSPSCRPRSTHGSFSPPSPASFCCFRAQPFHFSSAAIFTCKFKEEKAAEKITQQLTAGNQEVRRQIVFTATLVTGIKSSVTRSS